jgi:hypothetical protein
MATGPITLNKLSQMRESPKIDTTPFKKLLGDSIPNIEPSPLGRYRLLQAFRNKFGATYRNTPGVEEAIQHFDNEYRYHRVLHGLKMR